jgi:hypothetical protein
MSHAIHTWEGSTNAAAVSVIAEVDALRNEIVTNRRWFHQHPETAFEEIVTAAKVVELLKSYGIDEVWEGVGRTGVVAVIRGANAGPCIALRADMVIIFYISEVIMIIIFIAGCIASN